MSEKNDAKPVRPFVDVDQAREKPERLVELENQPDVGGVADDFTDTSDNVEHVDDADGLPGDKKDVYERGVTIMPPG